MEQVDKDINVRSKDKPMKTADYCDICKRDMCEVCTADNTNPYCVPSHYEIKQDEPQMDWYWRCPKCDHIVPNMYDECTWCLEPKPKDEPQTCSVSGRPYSECSDCKYFKCTADEPQKIMEKCYKCKWWNYSYGCSNKKGICEFEPLKDEPQTCDNCRFDSRYGIESICTECSRHYSDCYALKNEQSGKEK